MQENNIENRIVRKVHSIKILLDNRTSRSCNAYHNVGGNAENSIKNGKQKPLIQVIENSIFYPFMKSLEMLSSVELIIFPPFKGHQKN